MTTPAPLTIDIVIPTSGHYDLTRECLSHLALQTRLHTVIVSDNGGSEETAERVGREWPAARLIRSQEHLSFAAACNRGVEKGDGEVVVLLNNDVYCRPDWLERLVSPLEAEPCTGSVACLLVQPGEQLIDSVGLCADLTLAGFPRLAGQPVARASDAQPRLAGAAGGAAAYRRTAWEQVGGLDEAIFAYSEDLDLALRLRGAGWRAAVAPEAVGMHLGSATHGHRTAWQRRHAGFARGYLLRRYGTLRGRHAPRALATEAVVALGDAIISRDLAAVSGRVAGWRSAGKLERRDTPADALDAEIGMRDSLSLRTRIYGRTTSS
ncbi:MAG TPA: glycosyltransferase family 2 protein [Solirubrobacteraceae bacterium]|nr:glycosyltransferase family 2 protein [Solirubrobacteraceae bacterium]